MTKLISRNTTIPTKKSQTLRPPQVVGLPSRQKSTRAIMSLSVTISYLVTSFLLAFHLPRRVYVPQIEVTFDIDSGAYIISDTILGPQRPRTILTRY
ncbi:hypothetical protein H4582DRAFT_168872 [Lactarius indigo]|nr:hypothetical protein H4582DRAFT_168872 [Lactarius indigo]